MTSDMPTKNGLIRAAVQAITEMSIERLLVVMLALAVLGFIYVAREISIHHIQRNHERELKEWQDIAQIIRTNDAEMIKYHERQNAIVQTVVANMTTRVDRIEERLLAVEKIVRQ